MKKSVLLVAMIALFCGCTQKGAQEQKPQCYPKHVIAYVTSWSNVMPDPTYMTHINYAFGHVTETFDGVHVDNPERLLQITALKKEAPHLKVLLSIGGWGSGRFSEMAMDEQLRLSFAKDCKRVVDELNLDGIDIDWEYPTRGGAGISQHPDDTENYTLLMRDIRQAIGPDKLLTQATVWSANYMDHKALDQYIDFTNVMSYDMGNPPYHNAALYRSEMVGRGCADDAIQHHLDAGIPKHKLVMGMPFYGRAVEGFKRPKDLTRAFEMEGYTAHWDNIAKVPYLTDSTGVVAYCYDDDRSLKIKSEYILEKGLLGAMYWEYSGDNEAGDLQRIVFETLNGKACCK